MDAIYLLPSGEIVEAHLWDDLLSPKTYEEREKEIKFRESMDIHCYPSQVIKSKNGKTNEHATIVDHIHWKNTRGYVHRRANLYNDCVGLYFEVEGHKVYIKDYFAFSWQELRERLEEKEVVHEDDFIATFMKHKDEARFLCKFPIIDCVVPSIGMCVTSDEEAWVVCKFSERLYPSSKWSYKVELVPVDEALLQVVTSSRSFYTSDFISMIKTGRVKLTSALERFDVLDDYEINQTDVNVAQGFFSRLMKRVENRKKKENARRKAVKAAI